MKNFKFFLLLILISFPNYVFIPSSAEKLCNPLSFNNDCLLPFPSDFFTVDDKNSLTGKRLSIPQELIPLGLDVNLLNGMDGFSPDGDILIPFPTPISIEDIPKEIKKTASWDSPILILKVEKNGFLGEPIPFLRNEKLINNVLIVTPAHPLEFSTTYAVIVKKTIFKCDTCESMLNSSSHLFEGFNSKSKISKSDVSFAFQFTTMSEETATSDLITTAEMLHRNFKEGKYPKFEVLRKSVSTQPNVAYEIIGKYRATNFRDKDGLMRKNKAGILEKVSEEDVEFLLILPEQRGKNPMPIVIFGHGKSTPKETMFQICVDLAKEGIATIGIDAIGEGTRSEDRMKEINISIINLFRYAFKQTVLDTVQLVGMLRGNIDRFDFLPVDGPDGVPDIDPNELFYVGQSMGSLMGVMFLAVENDIKAAILNVPGGGFTSIMTLGDMSKSMFLDQMKNSIKDELELRKLLALSQIIVDDSDSLSYAPLIRKREKPKTSILLQESIGDSVVPNFATERLAIALGIPLLKPYVNEVYGLAVEEYNDLFKGSGLYQFNYARGYPAHLLMAMHKPCVKQIVTYFKNFIDY